MLSAVKIEPNKYTVVLSRFEEKEVISPACKELSLDQIP